MRPVLATLIVLAACHDHPKAPPADATARTPTIPLPPRPLVAPIAAPAPPELTAPIDKAIEKTPLLGLSVAIAIGGHVVLEQGFGFTELDRKTPVTPDTVFEIGSLTKQFTAAAVLTLVDTHQLALADPVSRYVPQITAPITIEQLLHQTSGLPDYAQGIYVGKTYAELVTIIAALKPDFTPGSRWAYSNTNYFLLSRVVEKVSGHSFAEYLRDHVLVPAKLAHTSYCTPTTATARPTRVGGGTVAADRHPLDVAFYDGAGALCSTAPDLLRWQDALFGGAIVSKASLAVMSESGTASGRPTKYGAGLIPDSVARHRRIWHNGAVPGGFESELAWYPDDHLQIVLLANTVADPPTIVLGKLDRALARAALHVVPVDQPLREDERARYHGQYAFSGITIDVYSDGDHLTVKTPTFTDKLLYQGHDIFVLTHNPDAEYRFDVRAYGPAQGVDVFIDDAKIAALKRLQEP